MNTKSILATVLVVLVVASGAVAAIGGDLNWGAEPAPQIEHSVTKTKDVHDMAWGTSLDALSKYEGDDGEVHTLEATVNTSVNNSVSIVPTDIEAQDFGAFPHAADVSALNASEWSGTGTATNVETAPGVEAVQLDLAAGEHLAFSNFSVTSDIQKRYLQVVFDVPSITSGSTVEFRAVDGDGDYYAGVINTSRSSGEDFMANASGEGYIYQAQLGNLNMTAAGDGSFGDIQAVNVTETGGAAATVEVAALNLDRTGIWDFGSHLADTDGDGDLESVANTEKKTAGMMELGAKDASPISTLGSTFDSALLHNIQIEMVETAAVQPDDNVYANFTKDGSVSGGDYPGYYGTATIAVRITDQSAYDLASSNGVLTATQTMQTNRILSVEYAEGVPADEKVDADYLDSVTFTDVSDQFTEEGSTVQLDATTSPGEPMLVKFHLKLTEDQFKALQNVGGGGGSGAQTSGGLGAIPIIGGLLVAILGVLRRIGG